MMHMATGALRGARTVLRAAVVCLFLAGPLAGAQRPHDNPPPPPPRSHEAVPPTGAAHHAEPSVPGGAPHTARGKPSRSASALPGDHIIGAGPAIGGLPGQHQHLPEWLHQHQNLTLGQQQEALRHEPGFASLPAGQQQRLMERLQMLDHHTPEQRARILARMENMERLSPEQRAEVRGAAQALQQMPPDRQRVVRRAFRSLRDLPPDQRGSALRAPEYAGQFTPQERTVLSNLLAVEPYQPQSPP